MLLTRLTQSIYFLHYDNRVSDSVPAAVWTSKMPRAWYESLMTHQFGVALSRKLDLKQGEWRA